jgi:hypothetical protein
MKLTNNRLIVALVMLLNSTIVFSQNNIWQNSNLSSKLSGEFGLLHYYDANDKALRNKLSRAPNEVRGTSDIIELPMPDGSLAKFSIVESSIMEDGLAEEFPQIKSYKVYGLDDPTASGRVDMSPKGFRGMLMTSQGRVFIDPATASRYTSSFRSGNRNQSAKPFQCKVHMLPENNRTEQVNFSRSELVNRIPGSLVTYRLAISATSEYVTAVGGTLTTAMAEINTAINRVNQIYERDLGIRFRLVTNNSSIIEVAPADFNFTNNNGFSLLDQNQTKIDSTIGTANYDIGHVFSTGGGGIARAAACTSLKANGVTGLSDPTGDGFYIDYVAHEIGHQFGGNHTFNSSTGSCSGGNRNGPTAFEPGSGSTILSYAGICGAENIVTGSDATFHAGSIAEINTYITGVGSCGVTSAITPANSDPTDVSADIDRVIPSNTAFRLSGSAVDAGDTLTYQWDQMDAGGNDEDATTSATLGSDLGNNPLFRSYIPQPTGIRDFPTIGTQVNGATTMQARGETLPTTARTLNFRLTVRDGKSGQSTDDVKVTVVVANPGFAVLSPNIAGPIAANTTIPVTWRVAETDSEPVSCNNVDIKLFTFSEDATTFGITHLVTARNNGEATVNIPNMNNSKARISIECSDNIFYDISNGDLNITGSTTPFPTTGNSANISTETNYEVITTTTLTTTGGGGSSDRVSIESLLGLFIVVLLFGAYSKPKTLRHHSRKK